MSSSWPESTQGRSGPTPSLHTLAAPPPQSDDITLYIFDQSVGRYVPPPANVLNDEDVANVYKVTPSTAAPDDFLGLLTGKLSEFNKYAGGDGSAWLLDIAHGICDPRHERGTLLVYDPQQNGWTSVVPSAPLSAASYLYYLAPGPLLSLTKICKRDRRSRTEKNGNGSSMRDQVLHRDGRCWVSDMTNLSCTNSHICPKRLGDALSKRVVEDFSGGTTGTRAPNSIFDPIFGMVLSRVLDGYFANFEIGFRYRGPNVYECHDFSTPVANQVLTILGAFDTRPPYSFPAIAELPRLHGFTATPPYPQADDLPPPAVFRWNYIQCVVKKFKHPDYENSANINMPMLEMRFASDSDDSDDDGPPDWPTAIFDIGRAAMADAEEERERMDSVAAWTAVSAVVADQ